MNHSLGIKTKGNEASGKIRWAGKVTADRIGSIINLCARDPHSVPVAISAYPGTAYESIGWNGL